MTPTTRTHALYADERNLALFSDPSGMSALGVSDAVQEVLLEHVPRTEMVVAEDAQRLWDARLRLFFNRLPDLVAVRPTEATSCPSADGRRSRRGSMSPRSS